MPSSHSSPGSILALPQLSSDLQSGLHVPACGGSQTSPTAKSVMPLPHDSVDLQSCEQPSPSLLLPSSQASLMSLMPLPQVSFDRQSCEQPSPSRALPSSQTSGVRAVVSTLPLPPVSFDWQSREQPSPSRTLPSSQTSSGSTWASPHFMMSGRQVGCAAAQCVPTGHSTPVASHWVAPGPVHAASAAANMPRHRMLSCRVIESIDIS